MFPNLPNMILLSSSLQAELEAKFKNWDRRTTLIGKDMGVFASYLLVYADYFNNLAQTQQIFRKLLAENNVVKKIQK